MQISIPSKQQLHEMFGVFGERCDDRLERTKLQEELWCLRRYLFTVASVGELSFPLEIAKCETPDFILKWTFEELGLEVTQATHCSDQREMTQAARRNVEVYSHGGYGGRGKGGYAGHEPHGEWVSDLLTAVKRKASMQFATAKTELLIYVNSNPSIHVTKDEALLLVRALFGAPVIQEEFGAAAFHAIHVLHGDVLIANAGSLARPLNVVS